jgi:predicted lipid carrier protein YhbT
VATVDECRDALAAFAANLAAHADEVRDRVALDRTIACRITDLGTAFHGRLSDGRFLDIADGDDPKAKLSLTTTSDDLIALLEGRLDFMRALTSRRVSVGGSPFDLLKLRKLL